MSDMRSAIADDQDDWEYLKQRTGLQNVTWRVYSIESKYTKEGFERYKLKGTLLESFVQLMLQRDTLNEEEEEKKKEMELYFKLHNGKK